MIVANKNRFWRVVRHLQAGEDYNTDIFEFHEGPIPELNDNEFLVKTLYLKNSPAMRGFVLDGGRYHETVPVGQTMIGRGLGLVVRSHHANYRPGDVVSASLGWQDYCILTTEGGDHEIASVQKITNTVSPLYRLMGILGPSAFAAYFGMLDIAQVAQGDTVVVSAAAGGVGSVAGQIAKIKGGQVIGIAGSSDKCDWLVSELGFDHAINYQSEDVSARLRQICPRGIDVFFDNVGGSLLDDVLQQLADHARVVICGLISTEYDKVPPPGPAHYYNLVYKRARMEGFIVWDYVDRFAEAGNQLAKWLAKGQLKATEDLVIGLDKAPDALGALFAGGNRGITVIQVAPDVEEII